MTVPPALRWSVMFAIPVAFALPCTRIPTIVPVHGDTNGLTSVAVADVSPIGPQ
jgi:hypothetical protein